MRTVRVVPKQTMLDIAVQEYGDMSAMLLIARANDISPTADLQPGTELMLPDLVVNKEMQDYCKGNAVSPATGKGSDSEIRLRIFTDQYTEQYM